MKASIPASRITPKQSSTKVKSLSWLSFIKNFLLNFARHFSNNSDVRIWQTLNREGYLVWHIYDVTTNKEVCFSTEMEVREWLERRYYR